MFREAQTRKRRGKKRGGMERRERGEERKGGAGFLEALVKIKGLLRTKTG